MNPTEQVRHATVLDDTSSHVARVYAEALYRAAEQSGRVDEIRSELDSLVKEVFRRTPELELILASAAISRERKQEVIDQVFAGRASDVFLHLLQVLNSHDRLGLLRHVVATFDTLCDQKAGRMMVEVRSAVPLSDEQRGRLNLVLRQVAAREPVLRETVDPDLLGGLVVQVGDWVYDASVRTKLGMMQDHLIERSSHGIQGG
jgi:F-type H+-transporting ATPase subunit delta